MPRGFDVIEAAPALLAPGTGKDGADRMPISKSPQHRLHWRELAGDKPVESWFKGEGMRGFLVAALAAVIAGVFAGLPAYADPVAGDAVTPSTGDGATSGEASSSSSPATATETKPPAPATAAAEVPAQPASSEPAGAVKDGAPAEAAPEVAPPPPPAHPVVAVLREKLLDVSRKRSAGNVEALAKFYADFTDAPLWVTADGFTAKGQAIVDLIRKSDEWGLAVSAFDLPAQPASGAAPDALADAEMKIGLAGLLYANHARGGRVDPASLSRILDRKPNLPDANALIRDLAASSDPASLLRSHHPKHPQFELLRQAVLKARAPEGEKPEEERVEIPSGPNLKPGSEHPHIALLRRRLKMPAETGEPDTAYDAKLADAVKAFQKEKGLKASGILTTATRNALNGPRKPSREAEIQRLLVNMERWRWMPDDLGELYVWDNVPEFMMSVVKKDEVIHSEKIIVGKRDTPTPMFSADMLYVVFHPEWGVPDSIKVKEIWPYLQGPSFDLFGLGGGGNTRILERHNLRVSYNGRPVNASQVDWSNVDVRRYTFIQPPGAGNVLGVVKFRFPNKHDVYMHDTPQRELFASQARAFSHGCMRVQNPRRLAEILLEEDQGMTAGEVGRLLAGGYNNEVALKKPIPVHVNYFTAVADKVGKVRTFGDLYGHDSRLAAALEGRRVPVADDGYADEVALRQDPRRKSRKRSTGDPLSDMVSGLFGN